MLAVATRLRRRTPRGGPKEGPAEQGTPSRAPGCRGPDEAGEAVKRLVVHLEVLHNDAEPRDAWREPLLSPYRRPLLTTQNPAG
jgi:hypothetical protein